ncbi:hypothetical protein [Sulfuritalea sp.]|uniref:hypothetical protein n=1 Tax=Sulfuritalea sp. TaxID=2480090 RepID=UPI00286E0ECB|nr:hypothetical protein [Sulfuritalea sp.]
MKAWVASLAVLVFGGCAALPAPPLHSAWYMQYETGSAGEKIQPQSQPQLYVALLNRSGRDIEVKDVILNRGDDESGIEWRLCIASTELPSKKMGKLVLHPGRLVVFPSKKFKRTVKGNDGKPKEEEFADKCLLPVEVAVELVAEQPWFEQWLSRAHGDSKGIIRAELAGRMPSSLPDGWDTACEPTTDKW